MFASLVTDAALPPQVIALIGGSLDRHNGGLCPVSSIGGRRQFYAEKLVTQHHLLFDIDVPGASVLD